MTPSVYACQECGYVGSVILEIEPDDNEVGGNGKKEQG